jgi:hypothetical protein
MTILTRSLPAFGFTYLCQVEPSVRGVIDLSHVVQPQTRLLIVTPSRGAQPPPAA